MESAYARKRAPFFLRKSPYFSAYGRLRLSLFNLSTLGKHPSRTSCKQDLEILGHVSKILPRSLKDNLLIYILAISDLSVTKILTRSVSEFLMLRSEKNLIFFAKILSITIATSLILFIWSKIVQLWTHYIHKIF